MMLLLIILQLFALSLAQFHIVIPVVRQRPVVQGRPYVRTNCCPPCYNSNRCRWNHRRPTGPWVPRPVYPPQPIPTPQPPPSTLSTSRSTSINSPQSTYRTEPTPTDTTTVLTSTVTSIVPSTISDTTTSTLFTTPLTWQTERSTSELNTIKSSTSSDFVTVTTSALTQSTTTAPVSSSNFSTATKTTPSNNYLNPCVAGEPLLNAYGAAISCNFAVEPNGGCPDNYWCHTGATFSTTVCCPVEEQVDLCSLPLEHGTGNAIIARWFFDKATNECKRFVYHGLSGNANNFISKAQCQSQCVSEIDQWIGAQNPCGKGTAALGPNNSKLICSAGDSSQCPDGFYCHIGETRAATACCKTSGGESRCLVPLSVGEGSALIKRFYYDQNEKQCNEFVYKGTKGNENNFLTRDECEKECEKPNDVCAVPVGGNRGQQCNKHSDCADGQWCHIGSSSERTICCGAAVSDPCSLPMESGEGDERLIRWYVDALDRSCNRQCKAFIYRGSKGNQNNFISKSQCEEHCKPQCTNVCGNNGSMLLDGSGKPTHCGPSSLCPDQYWCHVGGDEESTVCCSGTDDVCDQNLLEGTGKYHLTRWHFSKQENQCVSFIYRGAGGNQNMFLTLDDCRNSCPSSYENPCGSGEPLIDGNTPKICSPDSRCPSTYFCHIGDKGVPNYCCPKGGDPCDLPLSEGEGLSLLPRFYFDKTTRRCREFTYRGQKGNANNFLSKDDCESFCHVAANPCNYGEPLLNAEKEVMICGGAETCPSGYYCHVGSSPETTNCCPGSRRPCDMQLEVGKGREHLERWYFDGGVQMCKKFVYQGMKGNANNFISREACQEACKEMNPCGQGNPLVDSNGDRVLCTGEQRIDSCPSEYYCHIGASSLTTLCCERQEIDRCEQKKANGFGGAALPRWYFDSGRGKCLRFKYGGMGGNENNFISKRTCERNCSGNRNYCPHGKPLIETNGHQPITCGIDKACPIGFICHMSAEYNVSVCCQDPMDFCLQPRDPGPCNKTEKRFGYNPESDTCVEYEYGGCGGTLNNFKTLQRCTEICCKEYKRKFR